MCSTSIAGVEPYISRQRQDSVLPYTIQLVRMLSWDFFVVAVGVVLLAIARERIMVYGHNSNSESQGAQTKHD